jgi:hypothetical protein
MLKKGCMGPLASTLKLMCVNKFYEEHTHMEGNFHVGFIFVVFVVQKILHTKVRKIMLFSPTFTRNHENLTP